ncbi:MAG TPA: VOC family protein, partial [bacterium]|nr:VOC family protein [bacterium]
MKLQFHHFFVFAPPGAPQADRLLEAGFREGPGNRHPGQGTANRRFFFDNGMLEFLWVEDRDEAHGPDAAPTRLEERSRFRETGFAPFGVATHGPLEGSVLIPPFPCWSYSPPYLQPDQEIWVADNAAHPGEPMLFYAGFFPPPGRPAAGPLDHPN